MGLRQAMGRFLRVVMVVFAAVSFAMAFDVFYDYKPQDANKNFIKMLSTRQAGGSDASTIRQAHEKYMNEGVVIAQSYQARKIDLPVTRLPKEDLDALPRSSSLGERNEEEAFDVLAAARPTMVEPVLTPRQEERVADFGVLRDGSKKEERSEITVVAGEDKIAEQAAQIMPAAGGDARRDVSAEIKAVETEKPAVEAIALPVAFAPAAPVRDGAKLRVAVIIDDMGVSPVSSARVENLPAPLTLAYLPYAKGLPERTAKAKARGHELMVHMPMQPMNSALDGGPAVLSVGQSDERFSEILNWGLSQFDGYVGVNNHMGSRLTKDPQAMQKVMRELARRDVYFIDSKTIGSSVAAQEAARAGLRYAVRDVFLDHEISDAFVAGALRQLEATARRKGYAIAIGHPHPQTIRALEAWLPTLAEKGIELVPASALVARDARFMRVASE